MLTAVHALTRATAVPGIADGFDLDGRQANLASLPRHGEVSVTFLWEIPRKCTESIGTTPSFSEAQNLE